MIPQIIRTIKGNDGVYVVAYFGKAAGWVYPATTQDGDKVFKAVTVHYSTKHFDDLESAEHWLIGEYY
jgi:hypothetical protein